MLMKSLLFIILIFNFYLQSMEEYFINHDGNSRSYLKYIPDDLNLTSSTNLFIGIHGYTGTASGFEKETTGGFNDMADKYNFIAIYPQGLVFNPTPNKNTLISSWNDEASSRIDTSNGEICAIDAEIYPKYPGCDNRGRCSWTSCTDDIGFIKKIIYEVLKEHDIENIYLVGMSNGGMMAQSLACDSPDMFKAVANIVGMQHKNLSCIPDKPINFIIYGGALDKVVPPINITSNDGYYYEPMDNTFVSWSKKFRCRNTIETYNDTNDSLKIKTAYDCSNKVKIISILNMDRGHLWPGITKSGGYCRTNAQSDIDYNDCKSNVNNAWGNEYIVKKLLNL